MSRRSSPPVDSSKALTIWSVVLLGAAQDMITKMNLDADGDNRISKDATCPKLSFQSIAWFLSSKWSENNS